MSLHSVSFQLYKYAASYNPIVAVIPFFLRVFNGHQLYFLLMYIRLVRDAQ